MRIRFLTLELTVEDELRYPTKKPATRRLALHRIVRRSDNRKVRQLVQDLFYLVSQAILRGVKLLTVLYFLK